MFFHLLKTTIVINNNNNINRWDGRPPPCFRVRQQSSWWREPHNAKQGCGGLIWHRRFAREQIFQTVILRNNSMVSGETACRKDLSSALQQILFQKIQDHNKKSTCGFLFETGNVNMKKGFLRMRHICKLMSVLRR